MSKPLNSEELRKAAETLAKMGTMSAKLVDERYMALCGADGKPIRWKPAEVTAVALSANALPRLLDERDRMAEENKALLGKLAEHGVLLRQKEDAERREKESVAECALLREAMTGYVEIVTERGGKIPAILSSPSPRVAEQQAAWAPCPSCGAVARPFHAHRAGCAERSAALAACALEEGDDHEDAEQG